MSCHPMQVRCLFIVKQTHNEGPTVLIIIIIIFTLLVVFCAENILYIQLILLSICNESTHREMIKINSLTCHFENRLQLELKKTKKKPCGFLQKYSDHLIGHGVSMTHISKRSGSNCFLFLFFFSFLKDYHLTVLY